MLISTIKQILLLLIFAVTATFAGDCWNPLLNKFSFFGLSRPANVPNLAYCKSLKSLTSCCSAATINQFQTQTDQLKSRLRQMVILRDKHIRDTQIKFVIDFKDVAARFVEAANYAIPKLVELEFQNVEKIKQLLIIAQAVVDHAKELKDNFVSYQASRSSCIVQMVKLQAAAWCLACDPEYSSKGVSAGPTISLSTELCAKIENSCYHYIQKSADQSLLLQFRALLTVFQRLIEGLRKVADGYLGVRLNLEDPDLPIEDAAKPMLMPPGCDSYGNCQWACDNLFVNGVINERIIGNGGSIFGTVLSSSNNRRLEEEIINKNVKNRLLAPGPQWNPDSDEAGVDASFEDNPAKLSTTRYEAISLTFILILIVTIVI